MLGGLDTNVEPFNISDNILEDSFDKASGIMMRRYSPPPTSSTAAMDDDGLGLDDSLDCIELPPELSWLARAQELPGGVVSIEPEDPEPLEQSGGLDGVRPFDSGFSRPGSGLGLGFSGPGPNSRASTPESIVETQVEVAPPPSQTARGKRAFALPPRPQHGTTRAKGKAHDGSNSRGRSTWSWRSKQ